VGEPVTAADLEVFRAEVAALRTTVEKTLRGVTLLVLHLGALPKRAGDPGGTGRVATDAELDGKYGDGKVVCDPRDWQGASFKGGRMSECPAEYLDLLAVVLDGFADTETDAKKKKYKRDDAAKARGWAARKRAEVATSPSEDL
jgi:hypothetical protein